jgi:hypothetical protein
MSTKEGSNGAADPAALPILNGSEQEAVDPKDATHPAAAPSEVIKTGLMPHQKDEHDIWTCKECGWIYPNAKPSAKIRKNHKKRCPGSGGPKAAGGSSDEASDDEHHHGALAPAPATATPGNLSKEIDFAALKESEIPEVNAKENVEATPFAG